MRALARPRSLLTLAAEFFRTSLAARSAPSSCESADARRSARATAFSGAFSQAVLAWMLLSGVVLTLQVGCCLWMLFAEVMHGSDVARAGTRELELPESISSDMATAPMQLISFGV